MREFLIGKNDAGQRIDRFVEKAVPMLPGSLAQKYIRIKRIKVNGKGTKRDQRLRVGDYVQMYINDEYFIKPNDKNAYLRIREPELDIIYEDDNIILVNKKAGMLCHGDNGKDINTIIARIQAYLFQKNEWQPEDENAFRPSLCNRIDRNTSGIVIAAKNAQSLRMMNEKIKLGEVEKYYLAAVHGSPVEAKGRLENHIFKDAGKNRVHVFHESRPSTKIAIMEYETIAVSGGLSLLECKLITGRTHQIRAQLAAIGHPLLGDGKYGSERKNKPYGERFQALCSYKLIFSFISDAGVLQYLDKKEFVIKEVGFAKSYFGTGTE